MCRSGRRFLGCDVDGSAGGRKAEDLIDLRVCEGDAAVGPVQGAVECTDEG